MYCVLKSSHLDAFEEQIRYAHSLQPSCPGTLNIVTPLCLSYLVGPGRDVRGVEENKINRVLQAQMQRYRQGGIDGVYRYLHWL